MKIGILHYSMPPTVGGVERVIAAHARLFREQGHEVVLIECVGERPRLAGSFRCPAGNIEPPPAQPHLQDKNEASHSEWSVLDETSRTARETRALPYYNFIIDLKLDVLFVHNVFTMPFSLAATAACHRLAASDLPVVSWVHDLAAINPYYEVEPDSLIRIHAKGTRVVAISPERAAAYRALTGFNDVIVIPNGMDALAETAGTFLAGRPELEPQLRNAYPILFHPTRILRRKNIALGIQAIAELKIQGFHPHLLISGAPEPFSGRQSDYRAELNGLCKSLGVESEVTFLGDAGSPTDEDISDLYKLADALFFPSEQEGFGLPILEAGARGIPVFASQTQPLAPLAEANGFTFPLDIPPSHLARQIADFLANNPASRIRQTVRRDFDWQTIYSRHILPLLESPLR